eukprot:6187871-Pleurochrysis_carterae.AAC.2
MQNLLQLLMQSGALAEEELIELYASCVEAHRSAARAADLRVDTNVDTNRTVVDRLLREDLKAQLDPLGLKIAKMKHRDGKVYYGIGAWLLPEALTMRKHERAPAYVQAHAHAPTSASTHPHAPLRARSRLARPHERTQACT